MILQDNTGQAERHKLAEHAETIRELQWLYVLATRRGYTATQTIQLINQNASAQVKAYLNAGLVITGAPYTLATLTPAQHGDANFRAMVILANAKLSI